MTARAVAYQKRLIEQGKCPHCREVVGEINPRTGKPYQFCQAERARRRVARTEKYYRMKDSKRFKVKEKPQ